MAPVRFEVDTEASRSLCESRCVQFSPAIDPRLVASVRRIPDLGCSAEVWRGLRRRALRFDTTTPCYESVRRLVLAERERRARLIATLATTIEILTAGFRSSPRTFRVSMSGDSRRLVRACGSR